MLEKIIKFTNYNGVPREKKYYFHLNDAETFEWLTQDGDYTLDAVLTDLAEKRKGKQVINSFKELICRSYGERSLDGDRFIKDEELTKAFVQSEAYSILFMELISDPNAAIAFVKGILPPNLTEKADQILSGASADSGTKSASNLVMLPATDLTRP